MMSARTATFALACRLSIAGLVGWAGLAEAGGLGHLHHHQTIYQQQGVTYTTPVQMMPAAGVGMVASFAPVATTNMVASFAPVATSNMVMMAVPSATMVSAGQFVPVTMMTAQGGGTPVASTAPPIYKASSNLMASSGQATEDYLSLYNQFLQQEKVQNPGSAFVAAGVRTHPTDVAVLNQNYPQLVQALQASGGAERLGSFARFLLTKLGDKNFVINAIKLFEPILGTLVPGVSPFLPLINSFLNDLSQGSGQGTVGNLPPLTPPATPVNPPSSIPATGGTFQVSGQLVFTPVGGTTTPIGPKTNGGPSSTMPKDLILLDKDATIAPSP